MGIEIERKFLVHKEQWRVAEKGKGDHYQQGYLHSDAGKTIRVRLTSTEGFITIKGPTVGIARPEYEYTIPLQDARELLDQFCTSIISKYRYKIVIANKLWEVDEFLGSNEGLIIAEIELKEEAEAFEWPEWIDREVTGEKRYNNSQLAVHPYQNW